MIIETATPGTGTVDAPVSMESVLAEFETGEAAPAEATEAAVKELVEEAEEGHSEEEAETEDDATDADDTGEETAEKEPETGEEEPEPAFKVKVAGEEVEVPLSELVKGYSRERDYTQKTMALAEERRTLQADFANELKRHLDTFRATDPILAEAATIDWQQLAQNDPTLYVQLRAAVDERQKVVTEAEKKIEAAQKEAREAEQATAREAAAAETRRLVEAIPELADEQAMRSFATNAVNYLRDMGFDDGEIADATDHRALQIIDKARRFDALEKARQTLPAKKVIPKSKAKTLKTDGTHSSSGPKSRFPGSNAPRERQLDYVVNQFLKQE